MVEKQKIGNVEIRISSSKRDSPNLEISILASDLFDMIMLSRGWRRVKK